MKGYRGTEGTRPYAGAGWYYAEYRERVDGEFVALLGKRLGWTRDDRLLDLGAGPGQLSLVVAPLVAEVVALEPEPDMRIEGERRAQQTGADNVRLVAASSEDLAALRPTLGLFRTALMCQSFHWMLDKDRVLRELNPMIEEADGSVVFLTTRRVAAPEALHAARATVQEILERRLADVPPGPHPQGRHDPFEEILARSPFSCVERIERVYEVRLRPTVEALVGYEYSISHVLARLAERREGFESEVRSALPDLEAMGEVRESLRDEALIGRR